MWSIINTEGVDDWSVEVFWGDNSEIENCPFGGAECKTVILTQTGFATLLHNTSFKLYLNTNIVHYKRPKVAWLVHVRT